MKILKTINQGEMLPRFYGLAWVEWHRDGAVCAPVPLNWVIAVARAIWVFATQGTRAISWNPRDAYRQGIRDGRAQVERQRAEVAMRAQTERR
jgi:hypothetical protein